jgi:hypothetical protein
MTRYPSYRRLGGPQGRSGQVRKISPHRDSIPGPSRYTDWATRPTGIISKSINSLTSQKVVYTTLLAEAAVFKFSVLLILFLPVKNFHSLMKVDRRHVVFRQVISSLHAVSSTLTYCCYGLHGYRHNAKPSCSRSLKFSPWSEKV